VNRHRSQRKRYVAGVKAAYDGDAAADSIILLAEAYRPAVLSLHGVGLNTKRDGATAGGDRTICRSYLSVPLYLTRLPLSGPIRVVHPPRI
jgi:hypothetical protein